MVKVSATGYIYKVNNATNDITFAGMAIDSSATDETTGVTFAKKCIAEIDCKSADYEIGDGLKYSAANSLVDDGSANTLAWAVETTTSATRIKILVNAPALQKKFEVNA